MARRRSSWPDAVSRRGREPGPVRKACFNFSTGQKGEDARGRRGSLALRGRMRPLARRSGASCARGGASVGGAAAVRPRWAAGRLEGRHLREPGSDSLQPRSSSPFFSVLKSKLARRPGPAGRRTWRLPVEPARGTAVGRRYRGLVQAGQSGRRTDGGVLIVTGRAGLACNHVVTDAALVSDNAEVWVGVVLARRFGVRIWQASHPAAPTGANRFDGNPIPYSE